MPKLLSLALLALLILIACSDPAPTAVVPPTEAPLPEATAPSDSQPVQTQPSVPTEEPSAATTPRPTEKATTAPEPPTATAAPGPATITESTPTAMPEPAPTSAMTPTTTPTLTTVPAPTQPPTTPIPPATAASTPSPNPTLIPAATSSPAATSTPAPTQPPTQPSDLWRGITIAPENRCSPYDADEYRYSPSVEPRIVDAQGGIYGPYTGTWFETIKETDIEHIVARSEAHDSGLCASDPATWSEFASDLLNLTLASPSVNRHQKSDNDVAEWLPDLNQCWYVDRTLQVRRDYGLTIDRAEAEAADRILAGCQSTEMIVLAPGTSATATPTPTTEATPTQSPDVDALALWDDNGNGRITCAEARAHGIAPVHRGHPAYQYMNDADDDGVVCE